MRHKVCSREINSSELWGLVQLVIQFTQNHFMKHI